MSTIEIRDATVRAIVELVAADEDRVANVAGAGAAARSIVNRSRVRVRRQQLESSRETPRQTELGRVVGGLCRRLNLKKAADFDALIGRPQCHVVRGRSIGRDHLAGDGIDDWILATGEPCLIDCDVANQIDAARSDVAGFKQQVAFQFVLRAGAVLLNVSGAHIAIENLAR